MASRCSGLTCANGVLSAVILSVVVNGVWCGLEYVGIGLFSIASGIALSIAVMVNLACVALCLDASRRKKSFLAWKASFVYIAVATASFPVALAAREAAVHRFARSSSVLVDAIGSFGEEQGRLPASLEELTPTYLPQRPRSLGIPGTLLFARYDYEVLSSRTDQRSGGQTWELRVYYPFGPLNWDLLVYRPAEAYPDRLYGGSVERIRDWAYVHE
jgi:hypothetical protein